MRWLSLLKYLLNLIKTIPLKGTEIIKFSAKIKDILLNPTKNSIDILSGILKKQNFITQRVISIALLIIGMILGADIGIDYERKQIDPTLFEPKILTAPLDRPEDKITIIEPKEDITPTEDEEEIIVPLVDPLPFEYKQLLNKKKDLQDQ